ncbi:DUF3152 domain-containing protein [Streptomyces sp. NPDC051219]|uniref:DUF3152 domain-containing protein n=1 Tax=Streptomyces sp. NPDC051219 TaxID=3155283 RepID=UPI003440FCE8
MGRHSRKGPAPKGASTSLTDTSGIPFVTTGAKGPNRASGAARPASGAGGRGRDEPPVAHQGYGSQPRGPMAAGPPVRGGHPETREAGGGWGTVGGSQGGAPGPSAQAAGVYGDWRGTPRANPQTAAQAYGTPAHGAPAYGTPAHGTPMYGTPAQSGLPYGSPDYGTPAHGTPAHGGPHGRVAQATRPFVPGPRSGDIEAFEDEVFSTGAHRRVTQMPEQPAAAGDTEESEEPGHSAKGGRGRTFTGIAAAAVTTVLAVVVAGQVADGGEKPAGTQASGTAGDRGAADSASRSDQRPAPPLAPEAPPAQPATFAQKMAKQYPIDPQLKASGDFEAVPGFDRAPGRGQRIRYRVDVEKGLLLDGALFAEAVQKTLNDDRSWAHNGGMTFERVSSGEAEFVITLASPGTTGVWCAKSGLDTTVDNVSCDSASTDRVMINAFRWAQGADTYGPSQMLAYRQMLINHEVGHRLGHGHVNCKTPGALAPIMQQQTKSLDVDGFKCKPNPWVHPGS